MPEAQFPRRPLPGNPVNRGAPLLDRGQAPLGSFLHKMRLVMGDGIISMRTSTKPNESEGAYTL
jgi:hypothetical protein